ncbi:MAG: peptidoglycan DD-metalloendopeptidase family protein [Clostridia bacterium]|nr:peptidoglycan DD-metalloendopeptidase family protein [Clostridia bacterium]
MERTISVEEKIRRAEQIYARRQEGTQRKTATVTVNNEKKKDIKLLKKMIIQIALSLLIYMVIYMIQNNNYIFSQEFLNKANEILSYDMNFVQIYENLKQNIEQGITQLKNNNTGIIEEENDSENAIGGAIENNIEGTNTIQNNEETNIQENAQDNAQVTEENTKQLSQEEQDIANIKATTTFIRPVQGTISSRFGQREPTTSTVPKNHTGIDIAASIGTKIIASTGGEVVLASEEGDYGKHLKIQIGEVSVIYAHCNKLYVKQGDKINQGQEIAEVGSTGNSTGPHLHFEIRISERKIDPEKILEL